MSWKAKALKMHKNNMSWRSIARTLGKSKSTISDYLRKETKGYVRPTDKKVLKKDTSYLSLPKILILDIETSTMLLQAFGIHNIFVTIEQIEKDWNILSWSARWYGSKEEDTIYYDVSDHPPYRDDSAILSPLWDLLDEADIVVCHNAAFDTKKINSRFILNGMSKPSPYRVVDTWKIAKSQFGFTSNKLAYLTDKLCKTYKKLDHGEFAGLSLWKECLKGNKEAWKEMQLYNKYDVLCLEELFTILAPWDNRLPNMYLYSSNILKLDEWEECGYHYTNVAKYQRYRNKVTGQYKRDRTNLLTKEERVSLLTNIV